MATYSFESKVNQALQGIAVGLGKPIRPIEQVLDKATDSLIKLMNTVAVGPPGGFLQELQRKAPRLEEISLPTPFGTIKTPQLNLPNVRVLQLTPRKRDAIKAAAAIDLSSIVGLLPVAGDIVADVIEDTYGAQLETLLTPQERFLYRKYDKLAPSTVALLRSLVEASPRGSV